MAPRDPPDVARITATGGPPTGGIGASARRRIEFIVPSARSLEFRVAHPPRRLFVSVAGVSLVAPALLTSRKAQAMPSHRDVLSFLHTHTGEALSIAYRIAGEHVTTALHRINHLLRDHRTGDSHPIDPGLLDQLRTLVEITGTREPFQVISGYRSERTNTMLRATGGGGVAKGSLHLSGRAIDIRLADVPLATLRDAALSMRRGGVGYYPGSHFVHLDTGRFRAWG